MTLLSPGQLDGDAALLRQLRTKEWGLKAAVTVPYTPECLRRNLNVRVFFMFFAGSFPRKRGDECPE